MKLEHVKLEDIAVFQRGFDITVKEQQEGIVPVISSGGISSHHNEFKVRGPGVVIGRKGTLGTVHYSESDFWPHDTTLWVKDFRGNDPKFVYYFLKTLGLERFDAGASNPTLNRNHIHKLKVKLPNFKVRSKIASILSAYDELIENNTQRIALLEQMAQEIYKEWFVRLRFPGYEEVPVVDGLPEGWESSQLGETLKSIKRKPSVRKEYYQAKGLYPIIDQGDGDIGGYTDDSESVNSDYLPMVVFGDHTRRVKFVDYPFAAGADGTQLMYPKNNGLLPVYFYMAVRAIDLSNFAYARHYKFLKAERIITPDKEVVKKFNTIIYPLFKEIKLLKDKNENLKQTRDLLLPRLISGKLSVEHLVDEPQQETA
jgi:type I restriction enzyme S subunit